MAEQEDDAAQRGSRDHICVAVRFRPMSEREYARGDREVWGCDNKGVGVIEDGSSPLRATAQYDHVFDGRATNADVYEAVAAPVVAAACEGINGTVFAYGVTSSGKTHTMVGDDGDPGIVPRAVTEIFRRARAEAGQREYTVRLSVCEIYNEVVNDLLDVSRTNLKLHEDARRGTVVVEGAREEPLRDETEALEAVYRGSESRRTSATAYNETSSRSHTVARFVIEARESAGGSADPGRPGRPATSSVLCLIDLAGSESARVERDRSHRMEGSFINKSLLTLGTVIHKLGEGRAAHIPFRDSKLTRLLRSSLTGNGARVALVCTVTPASAQAEETHNTLKFASRAKRVAVTALRNEVPVDPAEAADAIARYRREIADLRARLDDAEARAGSGRGRAAADASDPDDDDGSSRRVRRLQALLEEERRVADERDRSLTSLQARVAALSRVVLLGASASCHAERRLREDLVLATRARDPATLTTIEEVPLDGALGLGGGADGQGAAAADVPEGGLGSGAAAPGLALASPDSRRAAAAARAAASAERAAEREAAMQDAAELDGDVVGDIPEWGATGSRAGGAVARLAPPVGPRAAGSADPADRASPGLDDGSLAGGSAGALAPNPTFPARRGAIADAIGAASACSSAGDLIVGEAARSARRGAAAMARLEADLLRDAVHILARELADRETLAATLRAVGGLEGGGRAEEGGGADEVSMQVMQAERDFMVAQVRASEAAAAQLADKLRAARAQLAKARGEGVAGPDSPRPPSSLDLDTASSTISPAASSSVPSPSRGGDAGGARWGTASHGSGRGSPTPSTADGRQQRPGAVNLHVTVNDAAGAGPAVGAATSAVGHRGGAAASAAAAPLSSRTPNPALSAALLDKVLLLEEKVGVAIATLRVRETELADQRAVLRKVSGLEGKSAAELRQAKADVAAARAENSAMRKELERLETAAHHSQGYYLDDLTHEELAELILALTQAVERVRVTVQLRRLAHVSKPTALSSSASYRPAGPPRPPATSTAASPGAPASPASGSPAASSPRTLSSAAASPRPASAARPSPLAGSAAGGGAAGSAAVPTPAAAARPSLSPLAAAAASRAQGPPDTARTSTSAAGSISGNMTRQDMREALRNLQLRAGLP